MPTRSYAILEAPSTLGLATDGVELLSGRLLEDQAAYGSQPIPSELRTFDLPAIRRQGVESAARAAVDHLTRAELDGFFIHVDADCLDDAIMPAVDFRVPGGLAWDELGAALRIALASEKAVGLEVAIYNPRLDNDGSAGRGLTDVLAASLGTASPGRGELMFG